MKVNVKLIRDDLFEKVVTPHFKKTGVLMTPPMIAKHVNIVYSNFHMMWENKRDRFQVKFIDKICQVTKRNYKEYLI